jgi:hypothetical protein
MGYIINRYNGQVLTTVEDGTVNLTTEVKFVGRNFAGYGETQNENFLHLMENFANPTPPGKPLSGMIWYDSTTNKIKFYDGTRWRTTGSAEVSSLQPTGNVEGDLWWNPSTNQLYARNAQGEWVLVGPQTTALGTTQFFSRPVQGIDGQGVTKEFSIIEAILSDGVNETTPLIIAESNFTLLPNEIDDVTFTATQIRKGITLADTNINGVSTNSILWGTASNALQLNGFTETDFVLKGLQTGFNGEVIVNDVVVISSDQDNGVIRNRLSDTILFKVRDNNLDNLILTINTIGLIPGLNNTYDVGTGSLRWKNIYATNFIGTSEKADRLRIVADNTSDPDPNYKSAKTGPIANSIAARDSSGNLRAVLFQGTATTARYADLAEKYTVEKEWPIGTAMTVCSHSTHEACPASISSIVIGVTSENPAYLMNSEIEGQAIGLKGRLPVRVIGPVKKGQAVYIWENGVCSTTPTTSMVGLALETNLSDNEKLVECVLKV